MTKPKKKCPQCDSDNVAAIALGFPSPEMSEDEERGNIVLGGCCVSEDDPDWRCKDCGNEW